MLVCKNAGTAQPPTRYMAEQTVQNSQNKRRAGQNRGIRIKMTDDPSVMLADWRDDARSEIKEQLNTCFDLRHRSPFPQPLILGGAVDIRTACW